MIQKSHFWVYSQRKWKQDPGEVPILPYLLHLIHNSEDMETPQVSIKDEWMKKWWYIYIYISLVVQLPSHVRLCDPMDRSISGPPVRHHLLKFAPVHVSCIDDAIQPSHPLTPSFPSALNLCQHQGLFQWVGYSHQMTIKSLHLKH